MTLKQMYFLLGHLKVLVLDASDYLRERDEKSEDNEDDYFRYADDTTFIDFINDLIAEYERLDNRIQSLIEDIDQLSSLNIKTVSDTNKLRCCAASRLRSKLAKITDTESYRDFLSMVEEIESKADNANSDLEQFIVNTVDDYSCPYTVHDDIKSALTTFLTSDE